MKRHKGWIHLSTATRYDQIRQKLANIFAKTLYKVGERTLYMTGRKIFKHKSNENILFMKEIEKVYLIYGRD